MKRYKDGNNENCYATKRYHFTITKAKKAKPVILESVLGCGMITRDHAALLLKKERQNNETVKT